MARPHSRFRKRRAGAKLNDYGSVGVDYDVLDAAKRQALAAASSPRDDAAPLQLGEHELLSQSRGEPAFVFKSAGGMFATVLECLGTKSVIAREYLDETGHDRFYDVGYDGVAAIVNDLICVGALPLVVHAYFATGASTWYEDEGRYLKLFQGWRDGCDDAGAVWGGGESPTLSGLIAEDDIEIAGSAVGFLPKQRPILGDDLSSGDEIVLLSSTGLHTNGASLARAVASQLPDGYATRLPGCDRAFGDACLDKSAIYTSLVAALLENESIAITYLSHITGHGLRKLMRADRQLTYRITELLPVPEVLSEIIRVSSMDDRTAYGTLNMGVGFAIFVKAGAADEVVRIAEEMGFGAVLGGRVEKGPRRVILEPLGVTFDDDDLQLRNSELVKAA